MKNFRYIIEAIFLQILMFVFAILPLDIASAFGGWIGRSLGMMMGISKRAGKNLDIAIPGLSPAQKKDIIRGMWDNLGRTIAEYPHLKKISRDRMTIQNEKVLKDTVEGGNGGIFISAHIGNWETQVPSMLARHGVSASLTYRALNNPYADKILRKFRTLHGAIKAYPKERSSGKFLLSDLKQKEFLAILIDQKYNEGVAVPFFDKPAMTNPVFVQLAQKYKCPLVPSRCKRLNGAHFELTIHEPLTLFDGSGNALPVETVILQAHKILESWIRDTPEQWLWLHRRWKSKKLAS